MIPMRVRNDDVRDLFRFDAGRRHGVSGGSEVHYCRFLIEPLTRTAAELGNVSHRRRWTRLRSSIVETAQI